MSTPLPRLVSATAPWRRLTIGVAAAVALGALPAEIPAAAISAPPSPGCEDYVVRTPAPLGKALAKAAAPARTQAAIQDANDLTRGELNRAASDSAVWVDSCGALFFVDAAHPHADGESSESGAHGHETHAAHATRSADSHSAAKAPRVAAADVPADVLDLSSRPGSERTIYLDFTGGTVTGTAWNNTYGSTIDVTPYSITAPADVNFTASESAEIYTAWLTVSEDFAPFDVNVTTRKPSTDALTRYSTADPTYGVTVKVTNSGPIYAGCGCGGVAYIDIFSEVGNQGLNPAWVFTAGSSTGGYELGQAASHEAGHTFGLWHDGTDRNDYYAGSGAYGPIMGASYGRRVSHWSNGEYPQADNYDDDIAMIASHAPRVFDDHGDNPQDATGVANGETIEALLGDRTDVDAFSFTGEGRVTFTAAGPVGTSNADLQIRVLNGAGTQVALVNPTSGPGFMDAIWTANLPRNPGTYTAIVDGVGAGSPALAGQYSDYGSLGRYAVTLDVTVDPLAAQATAATITGTVDSLLATTATVTVTGGVAPYTYSAAGLPAGWTMDAATGRISGTSTDPADSTATVTVTDAYGRTASATLRTVVNDLPPVSVQTLTATLTGTAGQSLAPTTIVSVTGGRAPYTYSATGLPAGWSISSSTGQVSGTAAAAQTATVVVTVTDARGRTGQASIGTVVVAAPPLTVQAASGSLTGTAGAALPATPVVTVTGGRAPYAYAATGLPSGWSISSSTGRVSGTSAAAYTGTAQVTVTDADGATAQASISIVVNDAPQPPQPPVEPVAPLVISPVISTLTGTAGKEMAGTPTVAASGGVAPYTFSAVGLPAGLSMDANTGGVSGVPIAAYVGVVSITVTDASRDVQSLTLPVTISLAPTPPPPPPPPLPPVDPGGDDDGAGGGGSETTVELEFVAGKFLPAAKKGKKYSATIKVTGPRVRSWTFSSLKGTGLKVAPKGMRAKVTGTPKKVGKVRLAVTVRATDGQLVKQLFVIKVR